MIMGIIGVCSRLVQALVLSSGSKSSSGCQLQVDPNNPIRNSKSSENNKVDDELMIRALTGVFGMQNNGKINKENARQVVEKLGLIYTQQEEEDEMVMKVNEVLSGLEQDRHHLLYEAFKIFDEDGNGYIEAVELKRVLQCLSLDKGWDITDIQNMLKVFDLNLDGKVDFNEFELMMMSQLFYFVFLNFLF